MLIDCYWTGWEPLKVLWEFTGNEVCLIAGTNLDNVLKAKCTADLVGELYLNN